MKRPTLILLVLSGIFIWTWIYNTAISQPAYRRPNITDTSDTLQKLQKLYNGVQWTNKYRRFEGDQFFLTPMFLTGSVTINRKTFNNVRLKYDIYSDELITPLNLEDIIQLNREMIDSFTLSYQNKTYRFINFNNDTVTGFNGYYNLLYRGKSLLYVRYQKILSAEITTKSDGEFIQQPRVYVVTGNSIYIVKNQKDLLRITGSHKAEVRDYISTGKLRINRNEPDSYIAVLEYYDSIRN